MSQSIQPDVEPRTLRAITQTFSVLPEDGWTLTTSDLDAWFEEVTGDA